MSGEQELADMIVELTGFEGILIWDKTMPDGQPRRCLDTAKAKKEFGFKAKYKLEDGLKKTIDWYKKNKDIDRI